MRRTDSTFSPALRSASRGGFTLMELLVVVSVIAILLVMAVPAISSIIASTEEASARNQLDVALSTARSVAVTSELGQDTAAVFFFKPGGRLTVSIFRKAGELEDLDGAGFPVTRDVYVPTGQQPFALPGGWMVRGLAPLGALHDESGDRSGWYEPLNGRAFEMGGAAGRPWWNWVFPENGFFDPKKERDDTGGSGEASRQTFMVRFEAGTGLVKMGDRRMALVIDPSPSNVFRTKDPFRLYRFNRGDDVGLVVAEVLQTREADLSLVNKRKLLGDRASDSVLAQGVTEIALYREADLAVALGARGLNATTRSLYAATSANVKEPTIDSKLFDTPPDATQLAKDINKWFGSDREDADAEPDEGGAYVYTIDRSSGRPTEVR